MPGVMKYRKKPVVIEAVKFKGDNWSEIEKFVPVGKYNYDGTFQIITLEGEHKCSVGDYVIKGVAGEFYPCKPGIFESTYEPADRRAPEPGTSVIRWRRYGDEKPDQARQYIRSCCNIPYTWTPCVEVPPNCWQDTDWWAYLPEPPEGVG